MIPHKDTRARTKIFSLVQSFIYAVLITIVVRALWVQPFNIPSSSMIPTLLIGDYVLATKYNYGYSSTSLFLPEWLFGGRILGSLPRRGDVVVFRMPNREYYVKRVMGLPGDTVQLRGGVVFVNGTKVPRAQAGSMAFRPGAPLGSLYKERVGGVSYMTLDSHRRGGGDNTPVFHVPAHHVFMLGDNRDHSLDSRRIGPIPITSLVGRVRFVYFSYGSYDPQTRVHGFFVRWRRFFEQVI